MSKKYRLGDLKVGLIVKEEELSDIIGINIILGNVSYIDDSGGIQGEILYIGEELPENIKELRENNGCIMTVFNNPEEMDEDTFYEE